MTQNNMVIVSNTETTKIFLNQKLYNKKITNEY